jgi:hypothetical protein
MLPVSGQYRGVDGAEINPTHAMICQKSRNKNLNSDTTEGGITRRRSAAFGLFPARIEVRKLKSSIPRT